MKKIRAILLSVGVIGVVSAALLCIVALIISKTGSLPQSSLPIITTVIGCFAVFLGGFLAALVIREKGILFGISVGFIFALCTALISVFLYQNDFGIASAGKLAAILFSGSIGGILGVNRKSKVKF